MEGGGGGGGGGRGGQGGKTRKRFVIRHNRADGDWLTHWLE